VSDALRGRGQLPRERQAARADQHRTGANTNELEPQGPPSRHPPGDGRVGGAVRTDHLRHREDRRPLTHAIWGGKLRAGPEEPGNPGVTGRCVVGCDRPREEAIRGIAIE
jgi:hypothetical protein